MTKKNEEKRYYTVAVKSPNSWNMDGSPIIEYDCGHKHRTLSGAVKCRNNLISYNKNTGMWSAKWNRAEVISFDHTSLTEEERSIIEDIELELDGYIKW